MNILSIQSRVAYGHVGNAAAAFALQRLGFEVWPVDTVGLSNHPGHATWSGRFRAAEELREILDGLDRLGVLEGCDAVLSGYLGEAGNGAVVRDAVARVRAANPRAIYCCDPVMGDREGGLFVRPEVPPVIAELTATAEIATPNAFELERLTGGGTSTLAAALETVDRLRDTGPDLVVVTGLRRRDGPPDAVELLAADRTGAWLVATPLLAMRAHGAGDLFAALFLGHYLRLGDTAQALSRAVSAVYAVAEATAAADADELRIIAAQDAIGAAEPRFAPVRMR